MEQIHSLWTVSWGLIYWMKKISTQELEHTSLICLTFQLRIVFKIIQKAALLIFPVGESFYIVACEVYSITQSSFMLKTIAWTVFITSIEYLEKKLELSLVKRSSKWIPFIMQIPLRMEDKSLLTWVTMKVSLRWEFVVFEHAQIAPL